MTILRAAALAALLLSAGLAHADGRRRYHDEAGLLVGIGIFADFIGASLLADLIAPPAPRDACAGFCVRPDYTPHEYTPYDDIGTRRSADAAWAAPD